MTRFLERTLIAGLLAAVVGLAAGIVARARTGFDGIWNVTIITDSGACDRDYRYPLRIANGRVYQASEGDQSFNIFGHVQPSGRVVVAVSRDNQRAYGSGRLSGRRGKESGVRQPDARADGKPIGAAEPARENDVAGASRLNGIGL